MRGTDWLIRPAVWFGTASMVTTILHELTHAVVAYALGVRSTLRNYVVNLELTPEQAATNLPAVIGIAGPSFCLVLGIAAWVGFKRARGSAGELPLLFLAVFGFGTFFGNLMSASFVGDFSATASALRLPMPARYAASLIGAVCTAAIHFAAGRELARWAPSNAGKLAGVAGIILVPLVVGTAAVILVNHPAALASRRLAEASFWMFAAIGALTAGAATAAPERRADHLQWFDAASAIIAIVIVRVLVTGVPFEP